MKATVEVYRDVCVIKILDDTGAVTDRYETKEIFVQNYRHERREADPEGTLPIVPKTVN